MRLALTALLCSGLAAAPVVAAAEHAAAPVQLRAQSVECLYTEETPDAAVCCTVRLHLKAEQGAALVNPAGGQPFASPLVGMDAAGRMLVGIFRGCESCLDNCRTLVYDFYTRPQGGWIEFDTSISICVSTGYTALPPVEFAPRRAAALQAGGMSFYFTPLPTPEGEEDPDAVFFSLEYEVSSAVHSLLFLDEAGSACTSRVLGGDYSEKSDLTRATYMLTCKGEKVGMQLRLHNPPTQHSVPVRFRAYMGILTDPAIGP